MVRLVQAQAATLIQAAILLHHNVPFSILIPVDSMEARASSHVNVSKMIRERIQLHLSFHGVLQIASLSEVVIITAKFIWRIQKQQVRPTVRIPIRHEEVSATIEGINREGWTFRSLNKRTTFSPVEEKPWFEVFPSCEEIEAPVTIHITDPVVPILECLERIFIACTLPQ